MNTIGDLIKTLEYCKEKYPEFEKYNLCIDIAPDDAEIPDLRSVSLYINTDIGQVEITPDRDDEWDEFS